MSSNTIFPEQFLSDYHKMSEEEQLKLALSGYLMKLSLSKMGDINMKKAVVYARFSSENQRVLKKAPY